MKKLTWILFWGIILWACSDKNDGGLDIPVEFQKELSFTPIPGGAIMKYYLPANSSIFGVKACYIDAQGIETTKSATYLDDSIVFLGFNEAQKNVPVQISFFDNNMAETEAITSYFDTEDSAPWAFFNNLKITPYWGGFSLTYTSPEIVNGLVHVFYLGTNPTTQQEDSILLSTMPIIEGGDTLNFVLQQIKDKTTVIVRTEDFRGYRVKQQIFADIPSLTMDTLSSAEFDFHFTGESQKDDEYQIGTEYLFDGDKCGLNFNRNKKNNNPTQYATYVAGPYAFNERFIIDLKEPQIPAAVHLYAYVHLGGDYDGYQRPYIGEIWNDSYISRLPCKIKLYGTNENPETVDLNSCALLFSLDDAPDQDTWQESWAKNSDHGFSEAPLLDNVSDAEILATEPVCLNMLCNYEETTGDNNITTGKKYRYLFFIVEDTFNKYEYWSEEEGNAHEYVSFNELEVCVKAEE